MSTPIAHRAPAPTAYLRDRVLLMMRRLKLSVCVITHAHARIIDQAAVPMPSLLEGVNAWLCTLSATQLTRLIDALTAEAEGGPRFRAPYPAKVAVLVDIAKAAIHEIGEHPHAIERMAAYDDIGQVLGRGMEATMPEAKVERAHAHSIAPLED